MHLTFFLVQKLPEIYRFKVDRYFGALYNPNIQPKAQNVLSVVQNVDLGSFQTFIM